MQIWMWASLSGLAVVSFFPVLPSNAAALLAFGGSLLLSVIAYIKSYRGIWIVAGLLFGLSVGAYQGNQQLSRQLPKQLDGDKQIINGVISGSIKHARQYGKPVASFTLAVHGHQYLKRLNLRWRSPPRLVTGQQWRLLVKLRSTRGLANPVGFDYQLYLLQQQIDALGTVKAGDLSSDVDSGSFSYVASWRESVRKLVLNSSASSASQRIMLALGLGDKSALEPQDWQLYQATGTSHLFIVSGLHISLLAGVVYLLGRYLICLYSPALALWPAQHWGLALAVVAAFAYALLSGFALPAQRAFGMFALAIFLRLYNGYVSLPLLLVSCLFGICFSQPLVLRGASLYLSFVAVIILIWQGAAVQRLRWPRWGRAQLAVSLGMVPLILYWFGEASVLAPIANMLAIPVVSLILVPLVLLLIMALTLGLVLPEWLLSLPAMLVEYLHSYLELLQHSEALLLRSPSSLALMLAMLGVALIVAPRGFPLRYLAPVFLLPLLMPAQDVAPNKVRVTQLDVGQGLAVVVEAAGKVLVYDTGPRYSDSFDTGVMLLGPFLRRRGYHKIDVLVVSHGDNDHAGGVRGLLQKITADTVLVGEALPYNIVASSVQDCHATPSWAWQSVTFNVLPVAVVSAKSNDRSCVLQVVAGDKRLLLTGDIELDAEQALLSRFGDSLRSHILMAPHHGSKTSSSLGFLKAVAPNLVLVSSAYGNRFGHPHAQVLARYESLGMQVENSADSGAIELQWSIDPPSRVKISRYRQQAGNFWMRW